MSIRTVTETVKVMRKPRIHIPAVRVEIFESFFKRAIVRRIWDAAIPRTLMIAISKNRERIKTATS